MVFFKRPIELGVCLDWRRHSQ